MTLIDERTGGLDRALGAAKRQNAVARFIFILNAPRHAGQSDHCARELAPSESTHAVVCVTRAPIRASFAFPLAQDSIPAGAGAALRHCARRRGLARMRRTPQLQSGNVGEDTVRCKPLAPRGTGSDGSRLHRRGNIPPIAKARCVWVYATLFLSRPRKRASRRIDWAPLRRPFCKESRRLDGRVKPGHDDRLGSTPIAQRLSAASTLTDALPSTVSPFLPWKSAMALLVLLPIAPSGAPTS